MEESHFPPSTGGQVADLNPPRALEFPMILSNSGNTTFRDTYRYEEVYAELPQRPRSNPKIPARAGSHVGKSNSPAD